MRAEIDGGRAEPMRTRPSVIRNALGDLHRALADDASGELAAYIPELARVDPERLGIVVATVDGHVYDTGDPTDLVAVLPGQLGIGTFSPRLDEHGNSCRGVAACEELGRVFSLHLLDASATPRRLFAAVMTRPRSRPSGCAAPPIGNFSTSTVRRSSSSSSKAPCTSRPPSGPRPPAGGARRSVLGSR